MKAMVFPVVMYGWESWIIKKAERRRIDAFEYAIQLVITFLPRSKCLLISWLQSPSAVILEPKKIKFDTVSTVSQYTCHEVMGPDAMIFVF